MSADKGNFFKRAQAILMKIERVAVSLYLNTMGPLDLQVRNSRIGLGAGSELMLVMSWTLSEMREGCM